MSILSRSHSVIRKCEVAEFSSYILNNISNAFIGGEETLIATDGGVKVYLDPTTQTIEAHKTCLGIPFKCIGAWDASTVTATKLAAIANKICVDNAWR